jgi:trimethylamine--corrinoid protein Co-methyltransferase
MAPITVAGAITLQHAEALAGITLAQITRPGAPVSNGGFSSNVDMKSGAPAFGTPDHVKLTLGAGQLARHVGLPFRTATGAASCAADAQGAAETANGLWAAMLAQGTMIVHAAGWLEGGLTFGYEKFVTDMETVQLMADLCARRPVADAAEIAFDAVAEVAPAGHFFAAAHTMARYRDAFEEPLVADLSNFGTWTERGSRTAETRATDLWKRILAETAPPEGCAERAGRVEAFAARRSEAGGAAPPQ